MNYNFSVCFRKRIWTLGILILLIQLTTTYKLTNSTLPEKNTLTNSTKIQTVDSTDLVHTDRQTIKTDNTKADIQTTDRITDETNDKQNNINDNQPNTDDSKQNNDNTDYDKLRNNNNSISKGIQENNDSILNKDDNIYNNTMVHAQQGVKVDSEESTNLNSSNTNTDYGTDGNKTKVVEIDLIDTKNINTLNEDITIKDVKTNDNGDLIEITTISEYDFEDFGTQRTMPTLDNSMDENAERIEHRLNLGDDSSGNEEYLNLETREVEDAVDYGLRKMHELVYVKEPELYRKGKVKIL